MTLATKDIWLTSRPSSPSLDTSVCFETDSGDTKSPVDRFVERRGELIHLSSQERLEEFPSLEGLVLVGVISSVETYLRHIIRETVLIDDVAKETSWALPVPYGAAVHGLKESLPDAFLENYSFVEAGKLTSVLKKCLGLDHPSAEMKSAIEQFERVCQIRHCVVHRSGRLGVKNAIALGFDTHKTLIEKPLTLSFERLQQAVEICDNLVKVTNHWLFCRLVERLGAIGEKFNDGRFDWDQEEDREKFMKYVRLFFSKEEPADDAHSVESLFRLFRETPNQSERT